MKTYHYCALSAPSGNTHYASGTFQFDGDINEPGAYTRLCNHVGARMVPPRECAELVLLSLTVIADDAAPRAAPPVDMMKP